MNDGGNDDEHTNHNNDKYGHENDHQDHENVSMMT